MDISQSVAGNTTHITPIIKPLKDYIKRRLRMAYLTGEIKDGLYSADDVLDEAMLRAYHSYDRKPEAITLHEWLCKITDEVLNQYVREAKLEEARKVRLSSIESRRER